MANLWNNDSGNNIATIPERVTTTVSLPISQPNAVLTHISGDLPAGLRLEGTQLVGTPYQVARDTIYKFVLRATYNNQLEDRTFTVTVTGPDEPVWTTPEDLLPVGLDGQYFILDSAPVDFQLVAIDEDTATGQELEYFIGSKDGELPPGIELTKTGKLIGVVDPILAIENKEGGGAYDETPYDYLAKSGYDWSVRPNNGFSSYFYDVTTYDLSVPTRSPKKLNRYYQFTVSVSDGDSIARRTFRIYVVGDDFFRADTTIMQVGSGIFTADITHVRTPIWITPRDFGYRRANNYITLKLDIIDPNTSIGIVTYTLASKNDDDSDSILPPGLTLDTTSGEIAGYTPYQPAVTKEYKFTVVAKRIEVDAENVQLTTFLTEAVPAQTNQIRVNKIQEYSKNVVGQEFSVEGYAYKAIAISTVNSSYDLISLDKPLHKSLPSRFTIDFGLVSITALEEAAKAKTFVIKLQGEVDSTIRFITPENLGLISSNYISTLSVVAESTVPDATLIYTLESGNLPPGLSLSLDGEIIGRIRSFGTVDAPGLTVFDSQDFKLDGNTTTIDRTYKFNVKAQDQFGYSAVQRNFSLSVTDPRDKLFSNISAQPFLSTEKRKAFLDLLNNGEIFNPDYIYRPNDPNFGLQQKMKMLIYSGIETKNIEEYVAKAAKNHKRKRLKMGEVKTAIAKTPGTNDIIYEVVYIEVIDPYESKNGKVRKQIKVNTNNKQLVNDIKFTIEDDIYDAQESTLEIGTRNGPVYYSFRDDIGIETRDNLITTSITDPNILPITTRDGIENVLTKLGTKSSKKYRPDPANTITVDSDAITIDAANESVKYISNISHMRDAIRSLGETERNYLPLWMRTPQSANVNELGFTNAIPLVFTKPGKSQIVKNNIAFFNIDFTQYDFDMDRYIIDSTTGESNEQYILFANYSFNI